MGILDTAKLVKKARDTQSQMKKLVVAGRSKSGLTAVLINGLNEVLEINFEDELLHDVQAEQLETEIIEAFNDARKQLEKELSQTMDMDSIRDMLS